MGKYLKKFETMSQYNAYTADTENFILPNVSLTVDNSTVHYNPSTPPTPPTPSYETVDLGLPSGTLWARYNVGATSETEYGNYYQYGKGADDYSVTSGQSDYEGAEDPLATSADTAVQVWGGNWHMPTSAQCAELLANTTYTWETNFNNSGINGGKFTAQNGNYIFIPAAGAIFNGTIYYVGENGSIHTSTPDNIYGDYCFYCVSGGANGYAMERNAGRSVRAVIGVQ